MKKCWACGTWTSSPGKHYRDECPNGPSAQKPEPKKECKRCGGPLSAEDICEFCLDDNYEGDR